MAKAGAMKVTINVICLALICVANAIESPQYTVVHLESDFEVRLYRSSVWMSAPARDLSFQKATLNGFHRYFSTFNFMNLTLLCLIDENFFSLVLWLSLRLSSPDGF